MMLIVKVIQVVSIVLMTQTLIFKTSMMKFLNKKKRMKIQKDKKEKRGLKDQIQLQLLINNHPPHHLIRLKKEKLFQMKTKRTLMLEKMYT